MFQASLNIAANNPLLQFLYSDLHNWYVAGGRYKMHAQLVVKVKTFRVNMYSKVPKIELITRLP